MRIKIYQINESLDKNHVKFVGMDILKKLKGNDDIDPAIYTNVFDAELEKTEPEELFQLFNTDGHPLYRGHSLSVSDVIVNDAGAFFCDNIGFKQIKFDESKAHKPDNLMRVVFVEPHKAPYITEIEHTLEAEQKAVGGFIEAIYNDDETCLIGNEESKLIGMEGNRRIGNGSSIIAGPFFVCGTTEDSFRGLTDEEVVKYMDRFAKPENISREEVEADTGFIIYSM